MSTALTTTIDLSCTAWFKKPENEEDERKVFTRSENKNRKDIENERERKATAKTTWEETGKLARARSQSASAQAIPAVAVAVPSSLCRLAASVRAITSSDSSISATTVLDPFSPTAPFQFLEQPSSVRLRVLCHRSPLRLNAQRRHQLLLTWTHAEPCLAHCTYQPVTTQDPCSATTAVESAPSHALVVDAAVVVSPPSILNATAIFAFDPLVVVLFHACCEEMKRRR